jgi:hypothetical protein
MRAAAKPRYAVLLFVPLFLLYGVLAFASGYVLLGDWSAIGLSLKMFAVVFLVLGLALLFWPIRMLASLGREPAALKFGGVTSALFGMLMIFGALSKILPCSGPA